MGLLTKLFDPPEQRARVGTEIAKISTSAGWLDDLLGITPGSAGARVNASNIYSSTALYAGVRLIASSIAQLPLHVYRRGEGGTRELQHHHRLRMLLNDAPNEWMTAIEFRELLTAWTILHGNAVAWLNLRQNLDIEEIIPLDPSRIRYWLTPDGQRMVYEYVFPNGRSEYLPRMEVLHLRAPLGTRWLGLGLLDIARNAIGLSMIAEEHASRFYQNAAAPAGVLVSPKRLSDDAWNKLKQRWEGRHKGAENAWRTALLEDGVEWKPLTLNLKDQQFLELRTFQVQEIARLLGLPPHMIGELSRSTNNNIEAQALEAVRYALAAWCVRWEQRIKLDCFGVGEQRTLYVKHALEAFTRGELLNRFRAYQIARMGGWMSTNEIRALEDRNGIGPEGDIFLAPLNMVPADDFGASDEAPPPAAPGTQPGGTAPTEADERAAIRAVRIAAPMMLDVAARAHRRAAGHHERAKGQPIAPAVLEEHRIWCTRAVEPVAQSIARCLEVPEDCAAEAVALAIEAVAGAWVRAAPTTTREQFAQRALDTATRILMSFTFTLQEA